MFMKRTIFFFFILSTLTFQQCYTLSGISIAPNTNTYYVSEFKNNAFNSPANLEITVRETLDAKIRTETKLTDDNKNPDIEFKGSVVDYSVTAIAPKPGETAALNRLTIRLAVEYILYNTDQSVNEDESWKQNFSYFFEFDSNQNLADIEEGAITTILEKVMEDIFNKAFANW